MADPESEDLDALRRRLAETEERLAETRSALDEARETARVLNESTPLGRALWRPGSPLSYCNERLAEICGLPLETIRSPDFDFLSLYSDADREIIRDNIRRRFDGEDVGPYALRLHAGDGSVKTVEIHNAVVSIGGSPWFQVQVLDVTARREAEDALRALETENRQRQKLEAVGTLATGIAHDFNNLLTVILGHTELLERRATADADRRHTEKVRGAVGQCRELIRNLLVFGRRQPMHPRVLDLGAFVRDLKTLLRRVVEETVRIEVKTADRRQPIFVDGTSLEQVLLNLAINARDAMPDGGTLCIRTDHVRVDPETAASHASLEPGAYAVLEVSDDGCGIAEEDLANVFDPFWTTKGPGKGTGLGLATTYGIVRQAGGTIEIESLPGQGTTVRVLLPELEEGARPAREVPVDVPHVEPAGEGTVLVVEDDPEVRAVLEHKLRDAGYDVESATDGREALERIRARGEVDVVVSDVVMPRMGGFELSRVLAREIPDLPVVLLTGYADRSFEGPWPVLEKPVRRRDLLAAMSSVLGKTGRGRNPSGSAT